jgi:hypothetical protein
MAGKKATIAAKTDAAFCLVLLVLCFTPIGPVVWPFAVMWALIAGHRFLEYRRERDKRCPHGIRFHVRTCKDCDAHIAREFADRRVEDDKRQKQIELASRARTLQKEECARLERAKLMSADAYFEMEPFEFESAIGKVFTKLGYSVEQTKKTGDGGKDLIMTKDGCRYVAECKRYARDGKTGRRDIQILRSAMEEVGATGAWFITTGRFTSEAIEYARKVRIELYDGIALPNFIHQAFGDNEADFVARCICAVCGTKNPVDIRLETVNCSACTAPLVYRPHFSAIAIASAAQPPKCEKCGKDMRLVNGKFWGCPSYPKCRSYRRHYRK